MCVTGIFSSEVMATSNTQMISGHDHYSVIVVIDPTGRCGVQPAQDPRAECTASIL